MTAVRSNNRSLKNQRFKPSGYNDIRMKKLEFVAKTQFLLQGTENSHSLWVSLYMLSALSLQCPS